jgi:Uma2 family endonuclease
MAMPLPVPTYTVDQVRAFPDDGCRYELVGGHLLVTPSPANEHQVVLSRLYTAIVTYLGDPGPAIAVSPGEIELRPTEHLEPDLLVYPSAFGPKTRWARISGWWLAVEVSGPASRRYDLDIKRDAYLALGVREVWVVDLRDRCVRVSRARGRREVRPRSHLTWSPPEMREPLVIDLARIFRGLD